MYQKEDILTDLDSNSKIINFSDAKARIVTGGNPPADENWLRKLNKGSIFLSRRKGDKALNLDKYFLIQHHTGYSELAFITPEGKQLTIWVSSLEFSRAVDYLDTLMEVELEEQEKDLDQEIAGKDDE